VVTDCDHLFLHDISLLIQVVRNLLNDNWCRGRGIIIRNCSNRLFYHHITARRRSVEKTSKEEIDQVADPIRDVPPRKMMDEDIAMEAPMHIPIHLAMNNLTRISAVIFPFIPVILFTIILVRITATIIVKIAPIIASRTSLARLCGKNRYTLQYESCY
jgi:hypothetical protein